MATWKKVIVSGSAADLASLSLDTALPVGSGGTGASSLTDGGVLLGSGTGAITALGTATNGQLVIGSTGADPVLGTLTGGSNISITNTAGGIEIAATGLGSGTVQSVAATGNENGITLTSDGDTVNPTITLGGALANVANNQLSNSSIRLGTTDISLGNTGSSVAGLTLTSVIATGSFTGSFVGDGSGLTGLPDGTTPNSLTQGTGITAFSFDGSSAETVSVEYGATAGTAVQGDTTITVNGTSNAISITGTAAQALGGAPSYTVDLSDTIDGDRTFTNDIIISGDLTVSGTASFQETENLLIADRFALFASGSATAGDGGIVVQQDTAGEGELFGYDSATTRWALTSSFDAATSAFTPDAFISAVVIGATSDPDDAPARYDKGGNIFVAANEDIYIYS